MPLFYYTNISLSVNCSFQPGDRTSSCLVILNTFAPLSVDSVKNLNGLPR